MKEGKPDEVTWHARTAPRLIEFLAAGVFLWGTVAYAMRTPAKAEKPKTVEITMPDGSVIEQPLIPEDYHDQPYYVEEGLVEPPTQATYNENLLHQPAAMEGITWRSGLTHDEKVDLGVYDPPMAPTYQPPIEVEVLPPVAAPTRVTHGTGLLRQPAALEGVTWRSGTRPQDRPDRG